MSGHRSDEFERYKHFSPDFKQETTEMIAGKLIEELEGTKKDTVVENERVALSDDLESKEINGGANGLEPATSNATGQILCPVFVLNIGKIGT